MSNNMTLIEKFNVCVIILVAVFLIGSCTYYTIRDDIERFKEQKAREDVPFVNDAGQRVVWVNNVSDWIKRHPKAKIVAIANQHVGLACIVYTVHEEK